MRIISQSLSKYDGLFVHHNIPINYLKTIIWDNKNTPPQKIQSLRSNVSHPRALLDLFQHTASLFQICSIYNTKVHQNHTSGAYREPLSVSTMQANHDLNSS